MSPNPPDALPDVNLARSLLFVPGDRADRFAKASNSGADVVVCDLEDAVAPTAKEAARERTARWLGSGGTACVRVNGLGTPWHDADLRAVSEATGAVAVVVPKAEDPEAMARVCAILGTRLPVVALVETARGVQAADAIASVPQVTRLAFGSLDFCLDIDAEHTTHTLLLARSSLVIASRAAGLSAPVDGVTVDVRDGEAVMRDAKHARSLGFGAKLCVHPRQVAVVNGAFSPSEEDVTWASRVLDAAAQGGVTVVDGLMVDEPVVEQARRVLGRYRFRTRG